MESTVPMSPEVVTPESPGTSTPDVDALLDRMRQGDRDAAAAFITQYGARVKRRIRGKLRPAMRRIFDSQDILSTVGRRLDLYVRDGRLAAANRNQLWALVGRMAERAVIDKSRLFQRLQAVEDEDGPFAQELLRRLRLAERSPAGAEIEIERTIGLFSDQTDRQILSLWLAGSRHAEIGRVVELSPDAVRKRWQKIRRALHSRLADEVEM